MLHLKVTGKLTYLKCYMPIGQHVTIVQKFLHIYYFMVEVRQHCKGYPSSPMILFLTLQAKLAELQDLVLAKQKQHLTKRLHMTNTQV